MSVEVGRKVVVTNVDWMGHFARVLYCRARSGIYPKGERIGQLAWCCQTKVENTTKRRLAWTSTLHLKLNQTLEACLS